MAADARADPRARHLPEPHLPGHRPRAHRDGRDLPGARARSRSCSPPSSRPAFDSPTSTATRSRPRSSSPATIVVVLLVDLFTPESTRGMRPVASPASASWRRWSRCSRWPLDGADRVMFGGAYVVDNFSLVLKALFLRRRLRRRAAVDQLHRRGRLRGGRVLLPAAVVAARHDGDGVGPRPHHDLRGPRAAVDPGLHARRLAQARPARQRGRA